MGLFFISWHLVFVKCGFGLYPKLHTSGLMLPTFTEQKTNSK